LYRNGRPRNVSTKSVALPVKRLYDMAKRPVVARCFNARKDFGMVPVSWLLDKSKILQSQSQTVTV
jgi:hypothetical protein